MLGEKGYNINGVTYTHNENLIYELGFRLEDSDVIIDIKSGEYITSSTIIREHKLRLLLID